MWDRLRADLRFGLRMLSKNRVTTVVAALTLAVGIGANTAVFSLVNALLLQPLPLIEAPRQLVALFTTEGGWTGVSSYMDFLDFRERSQSFSEMAAYKPLLMDHDRGEVSERVDGMIVSANYFHLLGVQPHRGRFFLEEEDQEPGAHPVAVLSYSLWQSRYASSEKIVGGTTLLNGRAFSVVGVAPRGFRGTTLESRPQVFAPMAMQPHFMPQSGNLLGRRGWGGILALARLADGATLERARTDLDRVGSWIRAQYPNIAGSREYSLEPLLRSALDPGSRSQVEQLSGLLLAVVGMVLLVACVNVANLLLARAAGREREVAMRRVLGAGRISLIRQLLIESLLLSTLGGALGLLLALGATRLLQTVPFPFRLDFGVDQQVLAFAVCLTILAAVLFGLAPALRATRSPLADQLGSSRAGDRPDRLRLRGALVVAQVALSLLLLVMAGLFARTLANLGRVDLGFEVDGLLTATLDPALRGYQRPQVASFYSRLLEDASSIPGVKSASLVSALPGPENDDVTSFSIEGYSPPEGQRLRLSFSVVGPGYFETMGLQVVGGRSAARPVGAGARTEVWINERAATAFEQATDRKALGARLSTEGPGGPFAEIIGVVADSKTGALRAETAPVLYLPHRDSSRMTLLLRTEGAPLTLVPSLRDTVRRIDPNIPLTAVGTLRSHLSATLFQERLVATLLAASAGIALLLAAVGLYGLLSYSVSQRTNELGIRMALGAERRGLLSRVVGQGLVLAVAGVVLGLLGAIAGSRLLERFLFEVSGLDPSTYLAVSLAMVAVATMASYLPARRATHIDPIAALRCD